MSLFGLGEPEVELHQVDRADLAAALPTSTAFSAKLGAKRTAAAANASHLLAQVLRRLLLRRLPLEAVQQVPGPPDRSQIQDKELVVGRSSGSHR